MFRRYRTYRRIARACRGTLGGYWATFADIGATLRAFWVSFTLASLPILLASGGIGFMLYEEQLNKYKVEHRKYLAQAWLSDVLARKLEAAESKRERANAAANDLLGKPGWYIVEVRRYREGLFAVKKHEMESCKSYFKRGDELWSSKRGCLRQGTDISRFKTRRQTSGK